LEKLQIKNSIIVLSINAFLSLYIGCTTSSFNWEQAENRRKFDGEVFLSKYSDYPEVGNNKFEYNQGVIYVYPKSEMPESILCIIIDSNKNICYKDETILKVGLIYQYYIPKMYLPIGKYTIGIKFKTSNKAFVKKFEILTESITAKYKRICPQKIAILPAINYSTDVEGAIVFRNLLYLQLQNSKKFDLLNIEKVDEILNEEGITDGGQLNMIENTNLFKILETDGLLFFTINEMIFRTYGIGSDKKVDVNFKIITPDTTYWNTNWHINTGDSPLSTILDVALLSSNSDDSFLEKLGEKSSDNLKNQIAEKTVKGWLCDHELLYEMNQVIVAFINGLPQF